jgi:protein involved in polysaccharide export with SLBB domain
VRRATAAAACAVVLALLAARPAAAQLPAAVGVDPSVLPALPPGSRPAAAPAIAPQPGEVDPAAYTLGPGDQLTLELWGRLLRTTPLDVSPEGLVFLPGAGPIDVAGRPLAWARTRILAEVDRLYRGVNADVRLTRTRTFKAYVTGLVKKPGAVEVTGVTRANEAVAMAEPLPDASRRNIVVRHRDGGESRLDLALFENAGLVSGNPFLRDGDVVHVTRAATTLDVAGAVASPGRYEFAPDDSLSTALALAGGLLPSAAGDRLLLVRFHGASERESLWFAVPEVLARRSNPPLADGDRVFAYYTADWHQLPVASIYGEVARPGAFPLVSGRDRLSDLVRWANGFLPRANRAALHLVRTSETVESDPEFDRLARLARAEMTESEYAAFQTKLSERRNAFRVDFERVSPGSANDPLLADGDIVRVEAVTMSVRVEGQVQRPGYVEFAPGRTLDDYVQLAGGFTPRAARSKIRVSRALTGQVVPADGARSIQPGDFVWVPEARDVDAWQVFKDVLAIAGQVAVIVVAARR